MGSGGFFILYDFWYINLRFSVKGAFLFDFSHTISEMANFSSIIVEISYTCPCTFLTEQIGSGIMLILGHFIREIHDLANKYTPNKMTATPASFVGVMVSLNIK